VTVYSCSLTSYTALLSHRAVYIYISVLFIVNLVNLILFFYVFIVTLPDVLWRIKIFNGKHFNPPTSKYLTIQTLIEHTLYGYYRYTYT